MAPSPGWHLLEASQKEDIQFNNITFCSIPVRSGTHHKDKEGGSIGLPKSAPMFRISPWYCERISPDLGREVLDWCPCELGAGDSSSTEVFHSMLGALPSCLRGVRSCQAETWIPGQCLSAFNSCTTLDIWLNQKRWHK